MKKIILLLVAFTLALTSCNKDDDNGSSQDPLIGNWRFYKYFENDVEQTLGPCDTEETIVFSSDGTYVYNSFGSINGGECEQDNSNYEIWENVGNGNYSVTIAGDTQTIQIIFEDNTFFTLVSDVRDGETIVSKSVYISN